MYCTSKKGEIWVHDIGYPKDLLPNSPLFPRAVTHSSSDCLTFRDKERDRRDRDRGHSSSKKHHKSPKKGHHGGHSDKRKRESSSGSRHHKSPKKARR